MRRRENKHQRAVGGTQRRGGRGPLGRVPGSSTLRRRALATWLILACLLTVVGAYLHFGHPVSVKLGANLKSFARLQLSYGGTSKEHISPLCGCWKEQSAESWRGITFAARRLALSRVGSAPLTAYVVTAPWPARMNFGGPWLALPVKSFGPIPGSFDPHDILEQFKAQANPETAPNGIITNVQYAILVSDQPLHIRQYGDIPLGAWIPMGGSTIAIVPELTLFPSSANTVILRESYQQILTGAPRKQNGKVDAGSVLPGGDQSNAELPALDLLGKRTVIWSEGASASVWLSETNMTTVKVGQAASSVGLVIDPVFSARVTVIPTSREALARFSAVEKDRLLPQPQDWLGVSETGSISLRLERTPDELQEFDKVAERLKVKDRLEMVKVELPLTGWLKESGNEFVTYETHRMDFRYPPSPPARGFNIFGAMAHLELEGATGSVVLGSRVADIPAPSTLEFRDIASFKAARGMIPVAVRGAADPFDTTLTFSGVSEAWLNGEPLTRNVDRVSWSTGFLLFVAGIVQAVAAAFGMMTSVFVRRHDDQLPQA